MDNGGSTFHHAILVHLMLIYYDFQNASFGALYSWQRKALGDAEEFVLHDGPPYANGRTHMGHALNKILKDFTNRYQLLSGKLVHYTPGWDCHGLPIEMKALEAVGKNTSNLNAVDIREKGKKKRSKLRVSLQFLY